MRKAECGVRNEENENIVLNKAKRFALRTIRLYQFLKAEKNEYVMSKQILRSGTSIGANICEAECGQTKADFYAKMNIALKEAAETGYWLELLHESNYIDKTSFESISADCDELMKLLKAITKTQKSISN